MKQVIKCVWENDLDLLINTSLGMFAWRILLALSFVDWRGIGVQELTFKRQKALIFWEWIIYEQIIEAIWKNIELESFALNYELPTEFIKTNSKKTDIRCIKFA